MVSFPLQCTTNLFYDLLLTFLFLSFPFLSFPSFLHLPTFSFPKLLATSQIKSLDFQPEFVFESLFFFFFCLCFLEAVILNHCPLHSFFVFLFMCFFFMLKIHFLCFVFLCHGHSFWPILTIVILVFVNLDCFFVYLFFLFPLWESLFVVL